MAEIRCPHCGRPNPAGREICRFCLGELRPSPGANPEGTSHPPTAAPGAAQGEGASRLRPAEGPRPEEEAAPPPEGGGEPQEGQGRALPEWLQETPAGRGAAEKEPDLARAELPEWLESMRPVEAVAPQPPETAERLEIAGPLAGLRGALPAEPEAIPLQKPPAYSGKLRVTAAQRAHADLLKSVVEEEGAIRPVPRKPAFSPRHFWRWGVGLALVLAILWPALTGSQGSPLPAFPEEVAEANRLIAELPAGARVLLAFDYEPGLSGEMDAAASAVVDHLMLRGAYLALLSTSPTGPILAERFLSNTQASHGYLPDLQYANLGYLPGGPSGLASFAESPQRALPQTLAGSPAWPAPGQPGLPALQGVGGIADFDLLVVLVDDPLAARAWIEQVQPRLQTAQGQTPLLMVASAQAEPLVRPFYQSSPRQVQGLVTGVRGGAAYARLTGRGGLPVEYWDAYSAGLLASAGMLLVGGLASAVFTLLPGRRSRGGEEPS